VRRPDYQGRLEGIKVHLREKPIAADIDYAELATLTGGMSGAQLAGNRGGGGGQGGGGGGGGRRGFGGGGGGVWGGGGGGGGGGAGRMGFRADGAWFGGVWSGSGLGWLVREVEGSIGRSIVMMLQGKGDGIISDRS